MENEKFASCRFSDFTDIKELYRSQAGAVFVARFKYDKKKYILKERTLPELGRRKDMMNEVNLLTQLDHYNVVRCEGYFRDESRKSLFIILEYCADGDLKNMLDDAKKKREYIDEKMIWHIFTQICQGVKHLHEHGIVHRDLKTMNVMIVKNKARFEVKIADLGVSRQLSEDTMMLQTFYGTPLYLSPELIENKAYNEKTDIWSIGIILYELATLKHPFVSDTLLGLAKKVVAGKYSPIPPHYSSSLARCIKWLLNLDFRKRPNIAQLLNFTLKRYTPGYPWTSITDKEGGKDHGSSGKDGKDGKDKIRKSYKSHDKRSSDGASKGTGHSSSDERATSAREDTDIEEEGDGNRQRHRERVGRGSGGASNPSPDTYYGDRVASREKSDEQGKNSGQGERSNLLLDMDALLAPPPGDQGAAPDTADTVLEHSLDMDPQHSSPVKRYHSSEDSHKDGNKHPKDDNDNKSEKRRERREKSREKRKSIDLSGTSDNGKATAGDEIEKVPGTALDKQRWDEEPAAGQGTVSRGGAAVDLKDGHVYGPEGYSESQHREEVASRFGEKLVYRRTSGKSKHVSNAAADGGGPTSMNGHRGNDDNMLPVSRLRLDDNRGQGGVVPVPMESDDTDIFNLPHKQYAVFDLQEEEKRKRSERAAGLGGWAADGSDFPKMSELDMEIALIPHRSGYDTRGKKGDEGMSPRARGVERDSLEVEGGVLVGPAKSPGRPHRSARGGGDGGEDDAGIDVIAASGERRHITRRSLSTRDDQHLYESNRAQRDPHLGAKREKREAPRDGRDEREKRIYQQQELRSLSPVLPRERESMDRKTSHPQAFSAPLNNNHQQGNDGNDGNDGNGDDIVSRVLEQKQKQSSSSGGANPGVVDKEQKERSDRKQRMFRKSTYPGPSTTITVDKSSKQRNEPSRPSRDDGKEGKEGKGGTDGGDEEEKVVIDPLRAQQVLRKELQILRNLCKTRDFLGVSEDHVHMQAESGSAGGDNDDNGLSLIHSDQRKQGTRQLLLDIANAQRRIKALERVCDCGFIAASLLEQYPLLKKSYTTTSQLVSPPRTSKGFRANARSERERAAYSNSPSRSPSPQRPSRRPGTAIEARNARARKGGGVAGKASHGGGETPQSRGHRRPASAIIANREKDVHNVHDSNSNYDRDGDRGGQYGRGYGDVDRMDEKDRVARLRDHQNEMKVRLDNARGRAGPGRDAISPTPLRGPIKSTNFNDNDDNDRREVQRVVAGSRPSTAGNVVEHGLATSRAAKAKLIAKTEAKKGGLFGPATPRASYDVDARQRGAQVELEVRREKQRQEDAELMREKMEKERERRALSPRYAHTPKPAAFGVIMNRDNNGKKQLTVRNNWREGDSTRMARAEYDLHNAYDAYKDAVNQDIADGNGGNGGNANGNKRENRGSLDKEDDENDKNFYTGHGSRPPRAATAPHQSSNTKHRSRSRHTEPPQDSAGGGSMSPRDVPRPREKPHTRNVDFRGLYDSTGLEVKSLYKPQNREKNSHNPYSSKERLPAYEEGNEKHSKFVERFSFNKNSTTRFHRVAPVSSGKAFRYVQNKRGVEEVDDGKFRLY